MKFGEIPFTRPDITEYEQNFDELLIQFEESDSFKQQNDVLKEIYQQRDEFNTMYQLAYIKYTANTADEALQKEVNHFGSILPVSEKLTTEYYRKLINSKYKNQLQHKWGQHLFDLASYKIKGFEPSIMQELTEENKLVSEYVKLKGTAEIEFEGKTFNLAGIGKYLVDKDRTVRKKASDARWDFFEKNKEQLDEIMDKLIKLRHKMSTKLGFDNFIKLGYIRMGRVDYDADMVSGFRDEIRTHIVPVVKKLRERQRLRLGLDEMKDFDLNYFFASGNPKPKGTPEEILMKAKQMYKELSEETDEFFQYMLRYDLLDVINRPGKADAGYCWELSSYKHPFIFANFNGTKHDIDVLTHEAGHAFQYFCCRNNEVIEYRAPGAETAEIHSMSMEFLTYPWMRSFFEEDTEKYFFAHMNDTLMFLPYGCAGDHFQHLIYENPGWTPKERCSTWKEMEKMYLKDRKLDSHEFLREGRSWQRQGHFFESPFYFIDYVLAETCALQFWQKNQSDSKQTWTDYLRLCNAGGTKSFLELIKLANLRSPFEKGSVQSIAEDVDQYLDKIDDTKF